MVAYYNEFDPFAAQWLRNLITTGRIAPGDVDERSILDVRPDDLRKYTQCHFFAGIGGWSLALRLAGWSDDKPVWTGSCPCQPFSSAGRQGGKNDDRHLWPVWERLIRECKPATVFGEQVASAVAHGWLDDVYQGLEAQGYAVGSAVLPACSVGAPHKRDRLFFVADASSQRLQNTISAQQHCVSKSTSASAWRELSGVVTKESWEAWQTKFIGNMLANGVPNRVGKLRGYGNAIVPQVAAEFIGAYLDVVK